ncbi:M15 family metallopeptidase [Salinicoccus sp. HZC-1]|uniref:M15 family metallopeptidase n=1 Tax=Salinicoccus sp. HZC-1 TaxID=3385497 RepID=UPI00398B8E92
MKNTIKSLSAALFVFTVAPSLIFLSAHSNTASANEAHQESLPEDLHPAVKENVEILKQRAAEKGILIRITDGFRSFEEQNALYDQGRSKPGNIVTYAKGGESYHNYGLAVDYALELRNGEVIWDVEYDGNGNSKSDWFEVAAIAKELGFTWGGDWEGFVDYPHLQMDYGLSIENLQNGYYPSPNPYFNF